MPPKKKTLGNAAPVPSLKINLPTYTIAVARRSGTAFYFQIPARLRPKGWAATYRLPLSSDQRTGVADAAEVAAVTDDAKTLYQRLKSERAKAPDYVRAHTLPWLIQSFEHVMKAKGRARGTMRAYAYAARQVSAWAKKSGDPHVRLITRPSVLSFLATMDATPLKRHHVASFLRSLMTHAMDKGLRTDNPCLRLGLETPAAKVHIWTETETKTMVAKADELGLEGIGTAIMISHDEGPRPGDILKFQRHREYAPREGALRYHQGKTDGWVTSPVSQRLRERLAKQPETQLLLVINPRTKRIYNERVFARDFRRVTKACDMGHLDFRHLRHTFVVNAKRAGLDEFEIGSKTGHSAKSVRDMLGRHYLPHDSEVATNATAKIEAYRKRKLDGSV